MTGGDDKRSPCADSAALLKPAIRCPRCGWREGYGAAIVPLDLLKRLYEEHFSRTHMPLPFIVHVPFTRTHFDGYPASGGAS